MEGMGPNTNVLNVFYVGNRHACSLLKISDDLRHCETLIADTYDDGHARSGD